MSYSWAATTMTADRQYGPIAHLRSRSTPSQCAANNESKESTVETTGAPHEGMSGVEYAVYFVATQQGGAARILRRHRPTPSGLCSGCLARPTAHPCQAARIAQLAELHPEYRAENTVANVASLGIPAHGSDLRVTQHKPRRWRRR